MIAVYKSCIYESVSACAVAFDLSVSTLHTWLHKYRKESTPETLATQISDLSQLKKELARAKMENGILKKDSICNETAFEVLEVNRSGYFNWIATSEIRKENEIAEHKFEQVVVH